MHAKEYILRRKAKNNISKFICKSQAKLERSDGELECLKIQGEQNSAQYTRTIEEKESYISDLLLQLKNDQSNANESKLDNTDDFKEMDSMEGGLVDVRNQIEMAAGVIKV